MQLADWARVHSAAGKDVSAVYEKPAVNVGSKAGVSS